MSSKNFEGIADKSSGKKRKRLANGIGNTKVCHGDDDTAKSIETSLSIKKLSSFKIPKKQKISDVSDSTGGNRATSSTTATNFTPAIVTGSMNGDSVKRASAYTQKPSQRQPKLHIRKTNSKTETFTQESVSFEEYLQDPDHQILETDLQTRNVGLDEKNGSSNEVRHSEPLFQNRLRQEVAFSNFRSKPNTVAILNFKALKEASVVDVASDSLGVKSTKADSFVDTVNKNVTGEAADQDAWEMEATTQNENEVHEDESMDWADIDPNLLEELDVIRKKNLGKMVDHIDTFANIASPEYVAERSFIDEKPLHIVVDTNVFVSQLSEVERLSKNNRLMMFVPWSVLHELDSLSKSEREIRILARKAIAFLQDQLGDANSRIRGQTGADEREAAIYFNAINADDRILQCCQQLQDREKRVILNTNDRNLAVKSSVNGIKAFNSSQLSRDLSTLLNGNFEPNRSIMPKVQFSERNDNERESNFDLETSAQAVLEVILEEEMLTTYDNLWTSIVAVKPKPVRPFWTLRNLLACFDKHWIAVFGLLDGVKRSDKELLDNLKTTFSRRTLSQSDRKLAAKKLATFLNVFRGRPKYGQLVQSTIVKLQAFERSVSSGTVTSSVTSEATQVSTPNALSSPPSSTSSTASALLPSKNDIRQLFSDVWLQMYLNITSYCEFFSVNYQSAYLKPIPATSRLPLPRQIEIDQHLGLLNRLVFSLFDSFQKMLAKNALELTTDAVEVIDFHQKLTTFVTKLDERRPFAHPPTRFSSNSVSVNDFVAFVQDVLNRETLDSGLEQLADLRRAAVLAFSAHETARGGNRV